MKGQLVKCCCSSTDLPCSDAPGYPLFRELQQNPIHLKGAWVAVFLLSGCPEAPLLLISFFLELWRAIEVRPPPNIMLWYILGQWHFLTQHASQCNKFCKICVSPKSKGTWRYSMGPQFYGNPLVLPIHTTQIYNMIIFKT